MEGRFGLASYLPVPDASGTGSPPLRLDQSFFRNDGFISETDLRLRVATNQIVQRCGSDE